MNLRPYQRTASDSVFTAWADSVSALAVMPTGTGKTVLAADVARRVFPKRTMFLAHRKELIYQARDKMKSFARLSCDVEMGDQRADLSQGFFSRAFVVVSSIQTQCAGGDGGGRMTRFDPMDFGCLIVDEAHHACSASYRRVIDYYRTNPDLRIMGITATPDRSDEAALGQVFDVVAMDYEILDAIHDGWLVPIEQQMVTVAGLDFSTIRTTAGDLNGADLAAVMENERNLHEMAGPSIDIIGNKRTLAFTSSVKHAEMLCEIFNRHRSGMAAWVCGKTDPKDRERILADFSSGRVQVVTNCGVLTEGFDNPGVEVILMGRPTKSRSLYAQMCGRSTRPLAGIVDGIESAEDRRAAIAASPKPSCLIVDFVGNSGRHKLMTSADILGGNVSDEAVERAILKAKKEGKRINMSAALDEAEEDIKREQEEKRLSDEARRSKLVAKARYNTQTVNPFDVLALTPTRERGWDTGKSLSEKQRGILLKQGIDPDRIPYSQGKQLLNEIFSRWGAHKCTFKQAKLLQKHGYPTDCSMEDAGKIIDALAANGWRKPA